MAGQLFRQPIVPPYYIEDCRIFDEGIANVCKKLRYHDGFLSPVLFCPQKVTVQIECLAYFLNPLITST